MTARRALVVTVVHHPLDARIRQRQITALLEAGWAVTYAAPFGGYGVADTDPRVRTIEVPRAVGRRRVAALRAARSMLAREARAHDVVLLHDPELLVAALLAGLRRLPPVVWDVHEDTAASVAMKAWLPGVLRRPAAAAVRWLERRAERRVHLLLAEDGYRARFAVDHPVVPNTTAVPARPSSPERPAAVYVGHLTRPRGVVELVATGRLLHERSGGRIGVLLIGPADADSRALLDPPPPGVTWHGFLPHAEAMAALDGALVGLSLLHDQPNYRVSRPSKVAEYLAHGVPVITTALPEAQLLVERSEGGVVVPFVRGAADPEAVADAVLALDADPPGRRAMGARGHAYAVEHLDWRRHGRDFVDHLAALAGR